MENSKKAKQISAFGSYLRNKLLELGWTYPGKRPPWLVGVHPCNRAYTMVDPIRCWQLRGLISSRGWSEHETKLALAAEVLQPKKVINGTRAMVISSIKNIRSR